MQFMVIDSLCAMDLNRSVSNLIQCSRQSWKCFLLLLLLLLCSFSNGKHAFPCICLFPNDSALLDRFGFNMRVIIVWHITQFRNLKTIRSSYGRYQELINPYGLSVSWPTTDLCLTCASFVCWLWWLIIMTSKQKRK